MLGNRLKTIIRELNSFESVRLSPELKGFADLLGKNERKMGRIVNVAMSYEEERERLVREEDRVRTICELPANALKLDLILEELERMRQSGGKDYKVMSFLLREGSRICSYHGLYTHAISLLLVIPDFTGIEMLLDDFIRSLKRTHSYEQRKHLLPEREEELIENLLKTAR